MDREKMIICSRCGEKIRASQRNCLKCGQLNFENPDNEYMKKYIYDDSEEVFSPKKFKISKLSIFSNSRPDEKQATKAGNLTLFALVNIMLFFLILLFIVIDSYSGDFSNTILDKKFISELLIFSVCFIELYSIELLMMKANKPWWGGFIVFGAFIGISFLLYLINSILLYIIFGILILGICYIFGVYFGKSPFLISLLAPVMLPLTAFSNTVSYKGIIYINKTKKDNAIEILYKVNKTISFACFMVFLLGIILIIFNCKDKILYSINRFKTKSFIEDAVVITDAAKKSMAFDSYVCSNDLSLFEQSEFYISFDNAAVYFDIDELDVSPLSDAYYEGYIKVVNSNDEKTKYYISIDDTMYGIRETLFEDVSSVYAEKNIVSVMPDDVVICRKNNLDK